MSEITATSTARKLRQRSGQLLQERKIRAVTVLAGVLILLAAATISAAAVDSDSGSDLLGLGAAVGHDITRLRWQYTAVVLTLAALHYLATAIAARAAAGQLRPPLGETVLVQLAAAAANRITPAGLGGSAVTARYFTRRGMDMSAAVGAVSTLSVLGALADFAVLTVLVLCGRWLGLAGASHEVGALTHRVTHLGGTLRSPWLWLVVAGVAVAVAVLCRRRGRGARHALNFLLPLRYLLRHPRRLATLLAASGSTTLILGFAFAASSAMVPGPKPVLALGGLLVAFMIGGAAGNAVPIPAGLGATEAALIAVLVSADVPAGHAVEEVLIFRLLTFWLPAILGVLTTRRLRRRHAL